jgi:hypothetical protein
MTKNNTPQKAPTTTKRKGLVEDLLAVTARAVVSTAIEIAPRIGEMILSGATRDETLDALDAALRASRSAVSAALSVRHADMRKRQAAPSEPPEAPPRVEAAPIVVPAPASIVWDDSEEKPATRNERPDPSLKAE